MWSCFNILHVVDFVRAANRLKFGSVTHVMQIDVNLLIPTAIITAMVDGMIDHDNPARSTSQKCPFVTTLSPDA